MTPALVIGIVSAIVIPLLGLAATWGALGQRLRALEGLPEKVEGLQKQLTDLNGRFTSSAESQGARIGRAQSDVDRLVGKFDGFERGFASGVRRTRTAAHGHQVQEGGKDE